MNKLILPSETLPPSEGIPDMQTVGELYEKLAQLSEPVAERFRADYQDVFDRILMFWDIAEGVVSCKYSKGTALEQYTKPIVADLMYKYDVSYRQAYIYTLYEYGFSYGEIAEHVGIHQSGVARALRIVRTKMNEMDGWYEY